MDNYLQGRTSINIPLAHNHGKNRIFQTKLHRKSDVINEGEAAGNDFENNNEDESKVDYIMKDDCVSEIIVHCTCGKNTNIECHYDDGPS